jgi:ankyrin repeat protein
MPGRTILLLACVLALALAATAQEANEEFFAAARKGDAQAVKAFLDKGTDVNAKTRYGATALSYASDKGHAEVAKLLLDRGADPNARDTFYGEVPLGWAVGKGHVEIIKLLLDKGAKGVDRVLMAGVADSNKEMIRVALDKGGFMSSTLTTALARANKDNKTEIAEMLKRAGAVPPPEIDAETLKSYEGTYKSQDTDLAFTLKDGRLVGGVPGRNPPFTLNPIDKTTFVPLEFDGLTITFNVEGGKVTGLNLKQGANNTTFQRVEQK